MQTAEALRRAPPPRHLAVTGRKLSLREKVQRDMLVFFCVLAAHHRRARTGNSTAPLPAAGKRGGRGQGSGGAFSRWWRCVSTCDITVTSLGRPAQLTAQAQKMFPGPCSPMGLFHLQPHEPAGATAAPCCCSCMQRAESRSSNMETEASHRRRPRQGGVIRKC